MATEDHSFLDDLGDWGLKIPLVGALMRSLLNKARSESELAKGLRVLHEQDVTTLETLSEWILKTYDRIDAQREMTRDVLELNRTLSDSLLKAHARTVALVFLMKHMEAHTDRTLDVPPFPYPEDDPEFKEEVDKVLRTVLGTGENGGSPESESSNGNCEGE